LTLVAKRLLGARKNRNWIFDVHCDLLDLKIAGKGLCVSLCLHKKHSRRWLKMHVLFRQKMLGTWLNCSNLCWIQTYSSRVGLYPSFLLRCRCGVETEVTKQRRCSSAVLPYVLINHTPLLCFTWLLCERWRGPKAKMTSVHEPNIVAFLELHSVSITSLHRM
jgi:hypothetical protein